MNRQNHMLLFLKITLDLIHDFMRLNDRCFRRKFHMYRSKQIARTVIMDHQIMHSDHARI